ncbi:CHAD domain-containing protein [Pseudomonas boanensis]|uniref:CHAD domain-containing protein n=1 Tax=Metapseudomonas boanensis TaxID=2822138 RepID=UPI0035D499AE
MSFVDGIVAQVLILETGLYHAYMRLAAGTDDEALHDLRINLRRLRSLLRPLRGKDGVTDLDQAAAEVGKMTTPVRDLEVLIQELRRKGLNGPANVRQDTLAASYAAIIESSTLQQFFTCLDEWPTAFRAAEQDGELRGMKKRVLNRLEKQVESLKAALSDPAHDRHQIRLRVKRTRYAADAYPDLSPISTETAAALKTLQSALGTWHDHFQWCLKAKQEPDLHPLLHRWQTEGNAALLQAEADLVRLAECLE